MDYLVYTKIMEHNAFQILHILTILNKSTFSMIINNALAEFATYANKSP
jgi:hypothetical protein